MTPADAQHEGDAAFSKLTEYCWKSCPVDGPHEAGCYDLREIALRAALRERDAAWVAAVAAAGIRMNEFGGIAVPAGGVRFENGAPLRALLEEAGK